MSELDKVGILRRVSLPSNSSNRPLSNQRYDWPNEWRFPNSYHLAQRGLGEVKLADSNYIKPNFLTIFLLEGFKGWAGMTLLLQIIGAVLLLELSEVLLGMPLPNAPLAAVPTSWGISWSP